MQWPSVGDGWRDGVKEANSRAADFEMALAEARWLIILDLPYLEPRTDFSQPCCNTTVPT